MGCAALEEACGELVSDPVLSAATMDVVNALTGSVAANKSWVIDPEGVPNA
jgi:hypothetical protein